MAVRENKSSIVFLYLDILEQETRDSNVFILFNKFIKVVVMTWTICKYNLLS